MWKKLILGALTVVLSASASFAQDLRRHPPPPPRPYGNDYPREYRRYDDPRDFRRENPRYTNRADYRHEFVYEANAGGSFENLGEGMWTENTRNGQFNYREVRRTPQVIELYDNARNIGVRLYGNMSYWSSETTNGWAPLYPGSWQ